LRILLVTPPRGGEELLDRIQISAPPLGLAYIAAVLEQEGHKVKIFDAAVEGARHSDVALEVKRYKPDLVGITSTTPSIYSAYKVAEVVKQVDPGITTVIGGPHVTFTPIETLKECRHLDYVVIGEGEATIAELVGKLEKCEETSDVRGIAYRRGDTIRVNKPRPLIDLNKLPPPARHLLSMSSYTLLGKPVKAIHVMASRGCPFKCIFCSSSRLFGGVCRYRDVNAVLDEIEDCVYRYKTRNFAFVDDEFTLNMKWVLSFTKGLKERGLDIVYGCSSRVDTLNEEVLKGLKESGCKELYIGVESGSQETIKRIKKGIRLEIVPKAVRKAQALGIEVVATFMLGFPWETVDDMKKTVKFALKLNPDLAQFTLATPYPGTELYEYAKKNNLLLTRDWSQYTTLKPVMKGLHFTAKTLVRLFVDAYRKFYLRPTFIAKQLVKGRLSYLIRMVGKLLGVM